MTPLVANARMYAVTPAARDLWAQLFEWIGREADVPLVYADHPAPMPIEELWRRDDLGLAFMCGYPFASATARLQAIAAPVPLHPRCKGRPLYWTDFVVSAESAFRSLPETFGRRIGWTIEHSQSGFNAVRHHLLKHEASRERPLYAQGVGPLVTPRRVVDSVLAGAIDVGPLDSYFHDLLARFEPDTAARLRTVARSDPTPMPLLVASPTVDAAIVERLRQALTACRDHAPTARLLAGLRLAGFEPAAPEAYGVLLDQAARAEAAGYHLPA
jgi:ABC-type phosphate/phosphonate transport system substrate-binding protein